ncbi:hypothetical protein TrCOL_g13892 [Triparma columacea]|uniref:Phosphoglycerate mutase-like protein n=1 Tax=Triparma columacea TaxID=722753 RepID=A0A9W7GFY2_9STRA|nr:hypothetical protein TrCOL_g13892 [Triparma columacea]
MTEPTDASGGLPEIETDEMDVENPTVDVPEAPMTPTPKPPTGPVPRSSPRTNRIDLPTKTVYLMRHGIARHNHHNIKIQSPIYLDASLDTTGAHQALAVGMRFRNVVGHGHVNVTKEKVEPIDLVCVSPLTRCLETAHHAWAFGCPMMPTETGAVEVEDEATRRRKLKHAKRHKIKNPLPMMHPSTPPPFVCIEELREASGLYYPDMRRPRSQLQAAFPYVDFSMIQTEEDELWREDKRESLSELNRRISKFWQWLGTRPEKNIAIVTHGVWIEECLRRNVPKVLRGGVRVQPADVFTCKVVPHVREEGPIEMHTLLIKDAKYDAVLSEADPNERGVKIGGD